MYTEGIPKIFRKGEKVEERRKIRDEMGKLGTSISNLSKRCVFSHSFTSFPPYCISFPQSKNFHSFLDFLV